MAAPPSCVPYMRACVRARARVCARVRDFFCMIEYMCVCPHVRMHGCTYACTYACMHACLYVCMHVRTHVRVRARVIIYRPLLGPAGVLFAVYALLAMFRGWHTFGRSCRTRKAECSSGFGEVPYFEIPADLWRILPHSQGQWPHSHTPAGASPGSPVGNTNDWILFLLSIVVISGLCFRPASLHSGQNTPKHRFLSQRTDFDP